ncbi:Hypothetical predicted protein [Lecanosticta acicola]|uniref:DUF3433 domain containing protein n=1 Tax=Lecanosticta acicola TaxID=111012 RepID=A0AAI8Z5M1_9PEZI|nr:Hypothetical predicted protein [Lecanosticta acicola]
MFQKPLPKPPKDVSVTVKTLNTFDAGKHSRKPKPKSWRPITLRAPFLGSLILATAGLVFVVQWLLVVSQRDQGIIFAEDINDLPLSRSFSYLYLPTVVSVIYSFLWTWVDLDVKRLEPYFQLSKHKAAAGADSILLSYPLEFLVTIPLNAFKRKHWSVLTASLITILVFWGLTPTQAGIFAVRTVKIDTRANATYSTDYTPISKQGNLTSIYAQSVYNIAWLDETLPPFMTRSYALSPFGPSMATTANQTASNFTGLTTLYSIDVLCEEATLWNRSGTWRYNSSTGCSFTGPRYRPNGGTDLSKPFDTIYVGYQNEDGFADYDLSSDCGPEFFHLFFVRWSKSTPLAIKSAQEPGDLDPSQANETALFCHANYFQQRVNATITLPSNSVIQAQPVGSKSALPPDLFNVSTFEWSMNSGEEPVASRGDYPTTSFPDQKTELTDLPVNLAYIPKMAPFAIATDPQEAEAYLDAETLRLSYQSAYRLLFARQLVDILGRGQNGKTDEIGHRAYTTQAVIIVPAFAYAVTILLACIGTLATILLILSSRRPNQLAKDPATIGELMELVAEDSSSTATFSRVRNDNSCELASKLSRATFRIHPSQIGSSNAKVSLSCVSQDTGDECHVDIADDMSSSTAESSCEDRRFTSGNVRPTEMKLSVGWLFLAIQIAAFAAFLALFIQANTHGGLPLPSSSTMTRQVVENYIPIALATFLEPFWLVLNRLLGLLQPFEELRKGNASASNSIELDYSSLPPQLLLARALRAGHYVLGLLCSMALLANALSVALGGIMYEGTMSMTHTDIFICHKDARIRALNGTGLPFNTNQTANSQGGTTSAPFYREMSNLTAGTPLPPWADVQYAYVPIDISSANDTASLRLTTQAFGASLDCQAVQTTGDDRYTMSFDPDAAVIYLSLTVKNSEGQEIDCTNSKPWTRSYSTAQTSLDYVRDSQSGHVALELNGMLASNTSRENNLFCRQHFLSGWIRADWKAIGGKNASISDRGLPNMSLQSVNATLLLCKPLIHIGPAEIVVDSTGRVQRLLSANTTSSSSPSSLDQYFTSTPQDLIAQANQFLIDSDATWHNDAFPSDYINYLMREIQPDTSLLDPSSPVPPANRTAASLSEIYARLFAILLSTNADQLLVDTPQDKKTTVQITNPETRILISTPAFLVTELILLAYIATTILFYKRRPWRILPRLPSTVASNIAFFAGSRALQEQQTGMRREERKRTRESWRWGYGKFVDVTGKEGIGIEREPFVGVVSALQKKNVETRMRGQNGQ